MIFGLLVITIPILIVLALIARRRFELAKPAYVLTGLGFLGAVMFTLGLGVGAGTGQDDLPAFSALGTLLSLIAFVGLIALTLIWAIRRWGLPDRSERRE